MKMNDKNKGYSLRPVLASGFWIVVVYMLLVLSSSTLNPLNTAFATVGNNPRENINAASLFQTGQMILGNNAKNLVILIPDEGHHGPGVEATSG